MILGENIGSVYSAGKEIQRVYSQGKLVWEKVEGYNIDINNYMTIEALEDGLTASLSLRKCSYCVNGDGNWISLYAGEETQSINKGQILSFKSSATPYASSDKNGIGTFTITKKCNLKGNCMAMLFRDNAANSYDLTGKDYAFYELFEQCPIVSVSKDFLPARTLSHMCYHRMFTGCKSLTSAPDLPATTLTPSCYNQMFYGCESLTSAPELPATTLAPYCYKDMFNACESLTSAPELPATTLEVDCYAYMFSECISLTSAPDLPATTLDEHCYIHMFDGCSKLNYIKMLATSPYKYIYLIDWVNGVASKGTFVKHPSMTSLPTGKSGIPSGWTVVNADV